MKKVLAVVAVLAAAGVAAYLYLGKAPQESQYRTAKVERGEILDSITATGNINAVITVSVGSQISGTIQQIFVDYNSRVKKGR